MAEMKQPGQHVCWVFDSPREQAVRIARWFQEGLEAGERVVHIERGDGAAALGCLDEWSVDWRDAVRWGQLSVHAPEELHLFDGVYDLERSLVLTVSLVEKSLAEGYSNVRMSTDAAAILGVLPGLDAFLAYEARIEEICLAYPVARLCSFGRDTFGAVLGGLIGVHPRGVGDGLFEILTKPGRVHVSGEVDISNGALLSMSLENVHAAEDGVVVDLSGLEFIDVAGTGHFVQLARRLAADGELRVVHASPQMRTIVKAVGWCGELDLGPVTAEP